MKSMFIWKLAVLPACVLTGAIVGNTLRPAQHRPSAPVQRGFETPRTISNVSFDGDNTKELSTVGGGWDWLRNGGMNNSGCLRAIGPGGIAIDVSALHFPLLISYRENLLIHEELACSLSWTGCAPSAEFAQENPDRRSALGSWRQVSYLVTDHLICQLDPYYGGANSVRYFERLADARLMLSTHAIDSVDGSHRLDDLTIAQADQAMESAARAYGDAVAALKMNPTQATFTLPRLSLSRGDNRFVGKLLDAGADCESDLLAAIDLVRDRRGSSQW